MTNILVEGREQVELADIGVQAERAKKILAKVRPFAANMIPLSSFFRAKSWQPTLISRH